MVEAQDIKPCPFCGSATGMFVHDGDVTAWVECQHCGAEGGAGKTRKEAIEIWNEPWKMGVKPLPCLRDQNGDVREQTVKALLAKIDEEHIELVAEIARHCRFCKTAGEVENDVERKRFIAEEAADTVTAITTLCEAIGIDANMRSDAVETVNMKNRARGRL